MIIHIKSVKPQESANGAIVDLTKNLLCSNQTLCMGFLERALAYKPKNIRTMAGPVRSLHSMNIQRIHTYVFFLAIWRMFAEVNNSLSPKHAL